MKVAFIIIVGNLLRKPTWPRLLPLDAPHQGRSPCARRSQTEGPGPQTQPSLGSQHDFECKPWSQPPVSCREVADLLRRKRGVRAVRERVAFLACLHPSVCLGLPRPPQEGWGAEELTLRPFHTSCQGIKRTMLQRWHLGKGVVWGGQIGIQTEASSRAGAEHCS